MAPSRPAVACGPMPCWDKTLPVAIVISSHVAGHGELLLLAAWKNKQIKQEQQQTQRRTRTIVTDLHPPLDAEPARPKRGAGKSKKHKDSNPQSAAKEADAPAETPHTGIRSPTPHLSIISPPNPEALPNPFEQLDILDTSIADLDAEAREIALQKQLSGAASNKDIPVDESGQQAVSDHFLAQEDVNHSSVLDRNPTPNRAPQYQSRLLNAWAKHGVELTGIQPSTSKTHFLRSPLHSPPSQPSRCPADRIEACDDESERGGIGLPVASEMVPQSALTSAPHPPSPPPPLSPSQADEAVVALCEYAASPT
ncbi:hypothetical protein K435DRAFT_880907, partial [Dendrothele bispora CBS 962.96]